MRVPGVAAPLAGSPEEGAAEQSKMTRLYAPITNWRLPVRNIERAPSKVRVQGGWVYSQGGGSLDDPGAAVHRRNRLGISRLGSYFSVDTGKYSVAPTLAERLARAVAEV